MVQRAHSGRARERDANHARATPVRIGLIPDTHGLLRAEALTALQGSDVIVHAGDIGDASILARPGAVRQSAQVASGTIMQTIGLIGGMSWESTVPYYRIINEAVRERLGGLHSARIVLHSVDFHDVERLQDAGNWTRAGEILAHAARSVEAGGADFIVLCTNTMHKVAPAITCAVAIPLLHIADPTAAAISRAGLSIVGLLGTRFTMEQDFYRDRLALHGIETIVPGDDDRECVHRVIYDELCRGIVRADSRARHRSIIERLVARGAEGIVLGCTEIAMLIGEADAAVTIFDTALIHASAAAARALNGESRQSAAATAGDRERAAQRT